MINVRSRLKKLDQFINASDAYLKLRKVLSEEEVFLLESLSGPKADKNKVVVGFNPILKIIVKSQRVYITGNELLSKLVNQSIEENSHFSKKADTYFTLSNIEDLIQLLRLIEAQFKVNYLGTHRDFQFGFFGYIDGLISEHFNNVNNHKVQCQLPDLYFSVYQGLVYSDLVAESSSLIINQIEGVSCYSRQSIEDLLVEKMDIEYKPSNSSVEEVSLLNTEEQLLQTSKNIQSLINSGQLYQSSVYQTLSIKSTIEPFDVYQNLSKNNPSPYMYFASFDSLRLIGASLELFIKLENGYITMRPVSSSESGEQAHLLLVDLICNEVAHLAEPASLKVNQFASEESYIDQSSLVSDISAKCVKNNDKYETLFSVLPPTALTGSPKLKSIESQDKTRSAGGCVGYIDFRGMMQMALCIRTVIYENNQYQAVAYENVLANTNTSDLYNKINKSLNPIAKAVADKTIGECS
ncbi:chorismate-binding protein [Thiotrichales bacterium 19S9-12]|nr:chorismate-binding protein [Thiotrichales bacterium 19S9-11]MCF6812253.1 chorismate-binding protein [Thiotrichales bacterium 19S9-12]